MQTFKKLSIMGCLIGAIFHHTQAHCMFVCRTQLARRTTQPRVYTGNHNAQINGMPIHIEKKLPDMSKQELTGLIRSLSSSVEYLQKDNTKLQNENAALLAAFHNITSEESDSNSDDWSSISRKQIRHW